MRKDFPGESFRKVYDFALKILKKYEDDEDPLPKMSIQNINEYLKEGCGIIASKQLPKTGFNRLVIKEKCGRQ